MLFPSLKKELRDRRKIPLEEDGITLKTILYVGYLICSKTKGVID